ncbi:MAG: 50S ribosomal protein L11 methyltransferase [Bacteroidetes bacterium]|nr:50S ribosomal protein L11 methyltransferase [Bacteroidota bacterium]MDA0875501.1 50S ribosomal protein L11 methyltransferase [Bacteroidota bacterium]
MPSIAFRIPVPENRQDELAAWLEDLPIEGLWMEGDMVTLYATPAEAFVIREALNGPLAPWCEGPVEEAEIADRNWNAEWEQTIQPIRAGHFRVRPTWTQAPPDPGVTDLIVDPKMSFGTGHHESTRLILSRIHDMVQKGDTVLDAGTGTGVLAFAALACGASSADSFDFDPICLENAAENAVLNAMEDRFRVVLDDGAGLLADPPLFGIRQYDVVLANINREVLRHMLPALHARLKVGGKLGLAGLLQTDAGIMEAALAALGLDILETQTEGDWWSVWAGKGMRLTPGERRVATIDIGTNTALLFVAGWREDRMLDLDGASGFVRLGEGVDASRQVSPAALERLDSVLSAHVDRLSPWEVDQVIVTGTSASRDAANSEDIRQVVWKATGTDLVILSGEEEARMTFEGAMAGLRGFDPQWVALDPQTMSTIIDVGGGSTEFVQGLANGEEIRFARSLDMGSVRMSERFFASQPPSATDLARADTAFRAMMDQHLGEASKTPVCVGASGTAVILSLVHYGRTSTKDMPDGGHLTLEAVRVWSERLLAMTRQEVLDLIPRHGKGREDVFPAGVFILRLAMEWLEASTLFVSPYGVRQGVALEHFRRSG